MRIFARLTPLHVVFSIVVGILIYFLTESQFATYIHASIYGALVFYFVQGLIINLTIDWAKRNSPDKLSMFLLGSIPFRLITSIFACIFALLIGIGDKELFIINFFAVYLVYLVFEMTSLVANLRPNLNSH